MTHGAKDWANVQPKPTTYALQDDAELAARLGSPNTYERLGDTVFMDSFDRGLDNYVQTPSGTGALIERSYGRGLHGLWALHLVGGSDGDRKAELEGYVAFPVLSKIGIEIAWTVGSNLDYAAFLLEFYTGALKLSFGVSYVGDTGQNRILNSAGGWTDVGTAQEVGPSGQLFIPAKFVVDPSTVTYVRFRAASLSLDVSGVSGQAAADATLPRLSIKGQLFSLAGFNAETYLDRFIVTQNEP